MARPQQLTLPPPRSYTRTDCSASRAFSNRKLQRGIPPFFVGVGE
jgi:hypothetical protein